MTPRDKGYTLEWNPHPATVLLLEQVDEILDEYADYLPMTVRQIYYNLVSTYGYPKSQAFYERMADKLVSARRSRRIPFWKVRDDKVVIVQSRWYEGIAGFQDETARRVRAYRRDRQAGQPQYLELWCEARGMLEQLSRVADDYSVPVASASGFVSVTGNHDMAMRAIDRNVPTVILHVGDHDRSGVNVFKAMTEDASLFVAADRITENVSLRGVRVALTPGQIEVYDLPTGQAKAKDIAEGWVGPTCEAEALPPDLLAQLVREAIENEMDLERWQRQVEHEDADRSELLGLPRGGR